MKPQRHDSDQTSRDVSGNPSGPNGDGFGQITLWRQTRCICEVCGRTVSRLVVYHPEAEMAIECGCRADG